MVQLAPIEKCTGCMACVAVCPCGAITIEANCLGDLVPQINSTQCISCKLCEKSCPILNELFTQESHRAYAAWSLDTEDRRTSASGGAASVFYARALAKGWWICGAEYSDAMKVVHTLTKDASAIQRYKQSKYVYSETGEVYQQIREKLQAGEHVLIISLPCKIAGLLGYLGGGHANLLMVDIVCHGTPAGKLLREHLEKVAPNAAEKFQLRFRQDNEFLFRLDKDGKCVYRKVGREDAYLAAFLEGLSYRDSCYNCNYANPKRCSDITICDFWGLGAEIPFDHPYTGAVSAVLVNTHKGDAFLEQCAAQMFLEERPLWEAVKGNAQLNTPTPVHPKHQEYRKLYLKHGFDAAVEMVLCEEMKAAAKMNACNQCRRKMRALAGFFLKRYRG